MCLIHKIGRKDHDCHVVSERRSVEGYLLARAKAKQIYHRRMCRSLYEWFYITVEVSGRGQGRVCGSLVHTLSCERQLGWLRMVMVV